MEKEIKVITKEVTKLLEQIGIKSTVEVASTEEAFTLKLDAGEDNALLIGKHGNTLASLELIITLIVSNKLKEFRRVTVEVGSYRSEREQYLEELAEKLKNEVVDTGFEKTVRGLKPWERRFVHMYLAEDENVITESTGEDRDRVLVIKKK